MSQRAVESVLGRLITDVDFRGRFLSEPTEACREISVELSHRETEALKRIDLRAVQTLATGLDPTIVRGASLQSPPQLEEPRIARPAGSRAYTISIPARS